MIGRTSEKKTLEELYASEKSKLVILYGRVGLGKTALLSDFMKGKQAFYYLFRECTTKEQLLCMQQEAEVEKISLQEEGEFSGEFPDYLSFLEAVLASFKEAKKNALLVLDEFHFGMKDGTFIEAIHEILANPSRYGTVLVLLCSSSVNWVENEMARELGPTAQFLSHFMKLKELSLMELGEWFPRMSLEDIIAVNAVVGGVPKYLKLWDERKSISYNIRQLLFSKGALLYSEAQQILLGELRELPVYNAILSAMARGENKLNDIYERTGFSRAKISVYLKNLIKLDLVEKVFSVDTDRNENVKKGLYCIKDSFLHFWYRFVFPYQSEIALGKGEEFFDKNLRKDFLAFQQESFVKLVFEYLKLCSKHKRLSYVYESFGSWHGKEGKLDILATDSFGHTLVALCDWSDKRLTKETVDQLLLLCEKANVKPDDLYLFTRLSLSVQDKRELMKNKNLKLIELKDL